MFVQGDAFKTLFVSRISFETTEKKLRREFEEYGPVKRIRLVHDATGAHFHLDSTPACTKFNVHLLCMGASSACILKMREFFINTSAQARRCSFARL